MELSFKNDHTAELEIGRGGKVSLNGTELPLAALEYLITYGVKQSLADSYASAKTDAEIEAAFQSRLAKIIAGEMRVGSGGGGARLSPVERIARTMAENYAIAKGQSSKDAKAWAKENANAFSDAAQKQHDALASIEIDIDI